MAGRVPQTGVDTVSGHSLTDWALRNHTFFHHPVVVYGTAKFRFRIQGIFFWIVSVVRLSA